MDELKTMFLETPARWAFFGTTAAVAVFWTDALVAVARFLGY